MEDQRSRSLLEHFEAASKQVVTVDVERYQAYLDESGLSDAEKEAFLEALWKVIVAFVDLGFGVHPMQEVCGKPDELLDAAPVEAGDAVDCDIEQTLYKKDEDPAAP